MQNFKGVFAHNVKKKSRFFSLLTDEIDGGGKLTNVMQFQGGN